MTNNKTFMNNNYTYMHEEVPGFVPGHEYIAQKHAWSFLKEGDIVFDIGAQYGNWTLPVASTLKPEMVHSFEPHKPYFDKLIENVMCNHDALRSRTTLHNFGLFDKKMENIPYSNLSIMFGRGGNDRVNVTTIDDFVDEYNIKRVDHIKMDAEGAELKIILGGSKTIQRDRPNLAIEEHNTLIKGISTDIYETLIYDFNIPYHCYSTPVPAGDIPIPDEPIGADVYMGTDVFQACRHGLYFIPGRKR